jgi:hypothetical protein
MMDKNRSNVMQALWENNLKLHIEAVHEENKPFKNRSNVIDVVQTL